MHGAVDKEMRTNICTDEKIMRRRRFGRRGNTDKDLGGGEMRDEDLSWRRFVCFLGQ